MQGSGGADLLDSTPIQEGPSRNACVKAELQEGFFAWAGRGFEANTRIGVTRDQVIRVPRNSQCVVVGVKPQANSGFIGQ